MPIWASQSTGSYFMFCPELAESGRRRVLGVQGIWSLQRKRKLKKINCLMLLTPTVISILHSALSFSKICVLSKEKAKKRGNANNSRCHFHMVVPRVAQSMLTESSPVCSLCAWQRPPRGHTPKTLSQLSIVAIAHLDEPKTIRGIL